MTAARVEYPEVMKKSCPGCSMAPAGRVQEVAKLAVYLASDDADYVTGQSFTIDGGLEMDWGQGA